MTAFPDPLSTLRGVSVSSRLIEEARPLAQSLEWRLSELYWDTDGTRGFVQNEIPYIITSSGTLSANAARLLFANCIEHPPQGPFEVLEIGSGTGLFARLFLEEFLLICERHGKPFGGQITYHVTDRSHRSLEHWARLGLFEGLPADVAYADALDPLRIEAAGGHRYLSALRAVFCNYSLDSLPVAVIRKSAAGPEELCIETHLTADAARIRQFTRLSLAEIRELAAKPDPRLIPLAPLLELEASFQPCASDLPYLQEALAFGHDERRTVLNYAAIGSLETMIQALAPAGFVLINDYGAVSAEQAPSLGAAHRFGSAIASGLNFPFLDYHFSSNGTSVVAPEQDERLTIHPRLFTQSPIPDTRRAFQQIFDWPAHQSQAEPQDRARKHLDAGRRKAAKEAYQEALSRCPRDWALLTEIAEFLICQTTSYQAGLQIAAAALAVNPWYSVWLWNIYGGALQALERFDEAHQAYLSAFKLDPNDVRTNLSLGCSHAQAGDYPSALEALGRGLANDRTGAFRDRLLQQQQTILASVQACYAAEQDWQARRTASINNC